MQAVIGDALEHKWRVLLDGNFIHNQAQNVWNG